MKKRTLLARQLGIAVVLGGVASIAVGVGADLLDRGTPATGFGARQALFVASGAIAVLGGTILALAAPAMQWQGVRGRPVGVGPTLRLAISFAVLASLPVWGNAVFQRLLQQPVLGLVTHDAWLALIPNVLLFLLTASVILGVSGLRRCRPTVPAVIATFTFLSIASGMMLFEAELHVASILLLSAGLAWRTSEIRVLPDGFLTLVQRGALPSLLGWIAFGVVSMGIGERREQAEINALPAAEVGVPNVVVIILDTVRAGSLSLYGYARPTSPTLIRLASKGVVFHRAFSTAPWTLPSHASLFTGYYPHDTSADWSRPLDEAHPTLAEAMQARGYATAAFVANRLYAPHGSGLERGFIHYDSGVFSTSEVFGSAPLSRWLIERPLVRDWTGFHDELGRKHAAQVTAEFLAWLPQRGEHPFFVFLNYYDAHDPYLPPPLFRDRFARTGKRCSSADLSAARPRTPPQMAHCVDAYDGAIAALDSELGRLLAELEKRGLLENTLVIVTSDHGEEMAEHGIVNHGRSLYLPSLHVPLVLVSKGRIPAGVRVEASVSLRDVPATLADLLGLREAEFPGRSLARHWNAGEADGQDATSSVVDTVSVVDRVWIAAETSGRPWLARHNPVSRGHMISLITEQSQFIRNGDGAIQVYDLPEDLVQVLPVTSRSATPRERRWFRSAVEPLVRQYERRH